MKVAISDSSELFTVCFVVLLLCRKLLYVFLSSIFYLFSVGFGSLGRCCGTTTGVAIARPSFTLDTCKLCISFADEFINYLVNIILSELSLLNPFLETVDVSNCRPWFTVTFRPIGLLYRRCLNHLDNPCRYRLN